MFFNPYTYSIIDAFVRLILGLLALLDLFGILQEHFASILHVVIAFYLLASGAYYVYQLIVNSAQKKY